VHRSVQAPAKAKPLPRNVTRPLPTSKRRKREAKDEAGEEGRQRVVARCVGWGLLWDWAIEFRRGVGYPQAMLNDRPGSPPQ
jgi:hypothetical protein